MNIKRSFLVVLLLFGLLASVSSLYAQDTETEIRLAAINSLNNLIPGIGNPQQWQYTLATASDSSLGCSLAVAGSSFSAPKIVYIITLYYPSTQYVFYVTEDLSQVMPCDTQLTPGSEQQTMATPQPAQASGSLAWRSTTCPADFAGYTLPRLYLAGIGRVTSGGVNNIIRVNFGRSSQHAGVEMPPGSTFPVVGEPECTGGGTSEAIVWWQVTYNDVTGWTAESLNGEYFLEPVDVPTIAVIPSPTRQVLNAGNAASIREIGQNVFTNQNPMMDMGKDGAIVVGTAQQVLTYSSISSGRIGPVGNFQLAPADYYKALSPSGDVFATVDYTASETAPSSQIVLWNTASITERMRFPAIKTGALRDIVMNSNTTRLFVFYQDMIAVPSVPYIVAYDLATGQSTTTINAFAYNGTLSPDDKLLATFDDRGKVYVWDAATLTQLAALDVSVTLGTDYATNSIVSGLAFSPDSKVLAVGDTDGRVQLWNVETGTLQSTLTVFQPGQASVLAIAFSPDGKLLAAGGGLVSYEASSTANWISVFDLTTNNKLVDLLGHTDKVISLAFSPDETLIFSAADNTLRVWGVQ